MVYLIGHMEKLFASIQTLFACQIMCLLFPITVDLPQTISLVYSGVSCGNWDDPGVNARRLGLGMTEACKIGSQHWIAK